MIDQLNKLIEFLKSMPPTKVNSTIGIDFASENDMIEFDVTKDLIVDLKGDWLFINAENFVGIVNINLIESITEI